MLAVGECRCLLTAQQCFDSWQYVVGALSADDSENWARIADCKFRFTLESSVVRLWMSR